MILKTLISLLSKTLQNRQRCQHLVYAGFCQFRPICRHQLRYRTKFLHPINDYWFNLNNTCHNIASYKDPPFIEFGNLMSEEEKRLVAENMLIFDSFLSTDEEKTLLNEIEPYMKRLRYEFSHWDNVGLNNFSWYVI